MNQDVPSDALSGDQQVESQQLVERIDSLESQLAFQEDAIQQLSDVIYDQQRQLNTLKVALERAQQELHSKIDGASDGVDPNAMEVPPHY